MWNKIGNFRNNIKNVLNNFKDAITFNPRHEKSPYVRFFFIKREATHGITLICSFPQYFDPRVN